MRSPESLDGPLEWLLLPPQPAQVIASAASPTRRRAVVGTPAESGRMPAMCPPAVPEGLRPSPRHRATHWLGGATARSPAAHRCPDSAAHTPPSPYGAAAVGCRAI